MSKGEAQGNWQLVSVSACAAQTLPAHYSLDVWALTPASRYTQLLRETQHGQGLRNTASDGLVNLCIDSPCPLPRSPKSLRKRKGSVRKGCGERRQCQRCSKEVKSFTKNAESSSLVTAGCFFFFYVTTFQVSCNCRTRRRQPQAPVASKQTDDFTDRFFLAGVTPRRQ